MKDLSRKIIPFWWFFLAFLYFVVASIILQSSPTESIQSYLNPLMALTSFMTGLLHLLYLDSKEREKKRSLLRIAYFFILAVCLVILPDLFLGYVLNIAYLLASIQFALFSFHNFKKAYGIRGERVAERIQNGDNAYVIWSEGLLTHGTLMMTAFSMIFIIYIVFNPMEYKAAVFILVFILYMTGLYFFAISWAKFLDWILLMMKKKKKKV